MKWLFIGRIEFVVKDKSRFINFLEKFASEDYCQNDVSFW